MPVLKHVARDVAALVGLRGHQVGPRLVRERANRGVRLGERCQIAVCVDVQGRDPADRIRDRAQLPAEVVEAGEPPGRVLDRREQPARVAVRSRAPVVIDAGRVTPRRVEVDGRSVLQTAVEQPAAVIDKRRVVAPRGDEAPEAVRHVVERDAVRGDDDATVGSLM